MERDEDDPEHCLLYAILNLPRTHDASTLQSQSRSLLRAFHPDKAATDDVQPTFLQIKLAVDTLSDPIMKDAYDYGGLMAVQLIKTNANLYELLADRCLDDRHAILSRVLNESQQARKRSTIPQWMSNTIQVAANAPCYFDHSAKTQRAENYSLLVTWKQNINRRIKASLVSTGLINLDLSSFFSVTFGKRLLFHASRVFREQSVVKFTAGLGMASVRTIRNLYGGTYLTVWGVDLGRGVDGTSIRSLMVSVQTQVWKIRLALADYFLKLSMTQFGFHGSVAWGVYGGRYKLVRSFHVHDTLELKYGVKLSPGSPSLLPIFYLSTPHLSLRIPVYDINVSNGWLVALLVVQAIEFLSGEGIFGPLIWNDKQSSSEAKNKQGRHRWDAIIRSVVAQKKRSRLEILRARFGTEEEDFRHWLQFWIDEKSCLEFQANDPRWEWLPEGSGMIRYSFDGKVFETTTRNGTLRLPSNDALFLGESQIVH